ncbi:uncharacterized protein AMSG_06460 [Thecamonas trahens ATCC 50062]|uniref:CNH domain-containing protein n=1 Tax=Thecamonas trahens ATCC 50062 TaxID=461836 RepID=A0A0L0DFP1_THETB|nr:hypothetical protein AMSG_06460 [Thecamonas trahens ATCC 50062]KNC51114.1 hypothetical protein AMSG_06460 [Thecamonas trahens ATCC 50062]|eukprot:XP_013756322.1 hypothetical protein AMSG_06460 [Thecamonas trahens ATCC 50062]
MSATGRLMVPRDGGAVWCDAYVRNKSLYLNSMDQAETGGTTVTRIDLRRVKPQPTKSVRGGISFINRSTGVNELEVVAGITSEAAAWHSILREACFVTRRCREKAEAMRPRPMGKNPDACAWLVRGSPGWLPGRIMSEATETEAAEEVASSLAWYEEYFVGATQHYNFVANLPELGGVHAVSLLRIAYGMRAILWSPTGASPLEIFVPEDMTSPPALLRFVLATYSRKLARKCEHFRQVVGVKVVETLLAMEREMYKRTHTIAIKHVGDDEAALGTLRGLIESSDAFEMVPEAVDGGCVIVLVTNNAAVPYTLPWEAGAAGAPSSVAVLVPTDVGYACQVVVAPAVQPSRHPAVIRRETATMAALCTALVNSEHAAGRQTASASPKLAATLRAERFTSALESMYVSVSSGVAGFETGDGGTAAVVEALSRELGVVVATAAMSVEVKKVLATPDMAQIRSAGLYGEFVVFSTRDGVYMTDNAAGSALTLIEEPAAKLEVFPALHVCLVQFSMASLGVGYLYLDSVGEWVLKRLPETANAVTFASHGAEGREPKVAVGVGRVVHVFAWAPPLASFKIAATLCIDLPVAGLSFLTSGQLVLQFSSGLVLFDPPTQAMRRLELPPGRSRLMKTHSVGADLDGPASHVMCSAGLDAHLVATSSGALAKPRVAIRWTGVPLAVVGLGRYVLGVSATGVEVRAMRTGGLVQHVMLPPRCGWCHRHRLRWWCLRGLVQHQASTLSSCELVSMARQVRRPRRACRFACSHETT